MIANSLPSVSHEFTLRIAIAKSVAWARKRATQPAWRPAATGGNR
jgi:hypothetical protein